MIRYDYTTILLYCGDYCELFYHVKNKNLIVEVADFKYTFDNFNDCIAFLQNEKYVTEYEVEVIKKSYNKKFSGV